MNKKIIKQIVVLAVALALALSGLLLSLDFNKVKTGAGNGKDAKIDSVEKLSSVMQSFNRQLNGFNAPSEEETPQSEYHSFTLHVTSGLKMEEGRGTTKDSFQLSRELNLYANDKASYYVSEGTMTGVQVINDNPATKDYDEFCKIKSFASFKIQMYFESDFAMVRFDKFDLINQVIKAEDDSENSDSDEPNLSNILGKWVYFSKDDDYSEVFSLISSINVANFDVFDVMFDYLKDKTLFDKNGEVWKLKEENVKKFMADLMRAQFGSGVDFDDTAKAEFEVNLRNKKEPKITLGANNSKQQSEGSAGLTYSSSGVDCFNFKNINNTVIEAPNINNALSVEEFIELVEG